MTAMPVRNLCDALDRRHLPALREAQPRAGGRPTASPGAATATRRCPWIADAGDDDFAEVAEQAPIPVLVDIWATWCGPCRMVSPALEQLATERAGLIKLVKVDVDTAPAAVQRFEIQAVPTLLVLRDGEVAARQAGAAPVPALRSWLDEALATPQADGGSPGGAASGSGEPGGDS